MIHATTDLEKSGYALHVCHCDQSVTVNDEARALIQGIEKIAELKLRQEKQLSLRMIIPLSAFRYPGESRNPLTVIWDFGLRRSDGN